MLWRVGNLLQYSEVEDSGVRLYWQGSRCIHNFLYCKYGYFTHLFFDIPSLTSADECWREMVLVLC